MNLLFLDTETTGFTHNRLVQLAWEEHPSGRSLRALYRPPVQIEEGASKVHGKTNEAVADLSPFEGSGHDTDLRALVAENIVVCHNADYDLKVLKNEGIEVPRHICTMKVARKVFPLEKDHKLQGLFERIAFDVPGGDKKAHDAMGDVLVMIGLFAYMFQIEQGRGLTEHEIISKWGAISSALPDTMPFGKHRGTLIKDLPTSYVAWCFGEKDFDPQLIAAMKHYLPHLA